MATIFLVYTVLVKSFRSPIINSRFRIKRLITLIPYAVISFFSIVLHIPMYDVTKKIVSHVITDVGGIQV